MTDDEPPESVEIPIDGTLDLHTFHPREVGTLVPHYLALCRERGILEVRLIHGKGTGMLRERVLKVLERLTWVTSATTAPPERGGWGATIVTLRAPDA